MWSSPLSFWSTAHSPTAEAKSALSKHTINLDKFNDEDNDPVCWPLYLSCWYSRRIKDKSDNDRGSQLSDEQVEDYDVDEEYDNDYAENYFDNGENDDFDNLGDGGGGDEGGGGEYSPLECFRSSFSPQAWIMIKPLIHCSASCTHLDYLYPHLSIIYQTIFCELT